MFGMKQNAFTIASTQINKEQKSLNISIIDNGCLKRLMKEIKMIKN